MGGVIVIVYVFVPFPVSLYHNVQIVRIDIEKKPRAGAEGKMAKIYLTLMMSGLKSRSRSEPSRENERDPTALGGRCGTAGNDHDLAVVCDETVDGFEVGAHDQRGLVRATTAARSKLIDA